MECRKWGLCGPPEKQPGEIGVLRALSRETTAATLDTIPKTGTAGGGRFTQPFGELIWVVDGRKFFVASHVWE